VRTFERIAHAFSIFGMMALLPNVVAGQDKRIIVPANSELTLHDRTIAYLELELNEGSVLRFDPSIEKANITAVTLTLHGKSTIDLTPRVPLPDKAPKPPTPGQAIDVGPPHSQKGNDGSAGTLGGSGTSATELTLSVQNWTATDGSLWIRTDGTAGGPGGDGGDGAKGAGPNTSGLKCYDGGPGGNGGRGGNGGTGGNTGKVALTIGPNTIAPTQGKGVAPSVRPATANTPGTIVVAGAPGAGGAAGRGGNGGDGGEGKECHFPASDAKPGAHGGVGPDGSAGAIGKFMP
jgi:hypothetical protein